MSHTSTPWNIAPQTCEYTATPLDPAKAMKLKVFGFDQPFECMAIENHEGVSSIALIPMDESNKENAEFICRAVNCHDDLLKILKEAKSNLDIGTNVSLIKEIEEAIAKAEAKS